MLFFFFFFFLSGMGSFLSLRKRRTARRVCTLQHDAFHDMIMAARLVAGGWWRRGLGHVRVAKSYIHWCININMILHIKIKNYICFYLCTCVPLRIGRMRHCQLYQNQHSKLLYILSKWLPNSEYNQRNKSIVTPLFFFLISGKT